MRLALEMDLAEVDLALLIVGPHNRSSQRRRSYQMVSRKVTAIVNYHIGKEMIHNPNNYQ